jgi:Ni,Fe-hydrogenase III small subunit
MIGAMAGVITGATVDAITDASTPVKIRLQGSPSEVEEITRTLRQWLQILEESDSCEQVAASGIMKRYLTVLPINSVTTL